MRAIFFVLLLLPFVIPVLVDDAFAEDNTVIATITVGDSPTSIAFDSENNRMYVLNRGDE